MATVKEALLKLEAHERECAVRMLVIDERTQAIEKRLDEGADRFKKTEIMLWGIYPLIIGLFSMDKGIW